MVGSRRGSAIAGPRCCQRDPWVMSNLGICLLRGKEWRQRACHNHSRIPEVNIHLGPAVFTVCRDSMHVPCFLCCKHGLGDFFPIQAASRREARKRLDESLSWVGVEWVRVAGWWLIGTQFWLSKQETPQSSPAVLFANLVSICSVCQEWLQRRATGNIWRPHHRGSGQASLQLSHHFGISWHQACSNYSLKSASTEKPKYWN